MTGLLSMPKRGEVCSAVASDAPPKTATMTAPWTLPGGVVNGGEIVLLAIKPSMWRPLLESAGWLAGCAAAATAIIVSGISAPGLSLGTTAQLIVLLGIARLVAAILEWVPTWYVLTNRRVVHVAGIREPRIQGCLLVDVRNTYLGAELLERPLGLGTITFVTDRDHEAPQSWRCVNAPQDVHARIRRAIENALDGIGT